jgi:phosphoribosylformimino-5-aminoimidazole carboxamide ribotide isomerase
VGGGIRDMAAILAVFDAGAQLAVLGTAAIQKPAFVEDACRQFPGRIVVAVDARDGVVAIEGWVKSSGVTAVDLGRRAAHWGAAALLYTDISRDGTQVGPNITATATLTRAVAAEAHCLVIASGGVSNLEDVRALADAGIGAVVIGRALYEGRFTLAEAIAAATPVNLAPC